MPYKGMVPGVQYYSCWSCWLWPQRVIYGSILMTSNSFFYTYSTFISTCFLYALYWCVCVCKQKCKNMYSTNILSVSHTHKHTHIHQDQNHAFWLQQKSISYNKTTTTTNTLHKNFFANTMHSGFIKNQCHALCHAKSLLMLCIMTSPKIIANAVHYDFAKNHCHCYALSSSKTIAMHYDFTKKHCYALWCHQKSLPCTLNSSGTGHTCQSTPPTIPLSHSAMSPSRMKVAQQM